MNAAEFVIKFAKKRRNHYMSVHNNGGVPFFMKKMKAIEAIIMQMESVKLKSNRAQFISILAMQENIMEILPTPYCRFQDMRIEMLKLIEEGNQLINEHAS